MPACPLALLALLAVAVTAAGDPAGPCESEMNKIKDLLQVNCAAQGLASLPAGLPKDTGILQLGANRLARISLASFRHLSLLSELDLSNNSVAALEADAPLPTLQQLVLSHNALESLPTFQGLPRLWRLALDHNSLSELPERGFRALESLRDLELQGNRLRRLPPGAFLGLAQLRDLDLSDNDLEGLPGALLAGLPELEILRLERNRLQSLPDGFFPEETPFAYVYLAENPWRCDCSLVYLRDWIAENEISVYTRTPGPAEEITENNPESVKCHAPATDRGKPVVHFQVACRRPGDTEEEEEEEEPASAWHPGATSPLPPPPATTAALPPRALSTPAATPRGTTVSATASLPSTASLRTRSPSPTAGHSTWPSMAALRTPSPSPTATPTTGVPTVATCTTITTSSPSPPAPLRSTLATALSPVSSAQRPAPSVAPETTRPPPAAAATSRPPAARPTAIPLSTAGAGASSRPPAGLPASEPAAHCPCRAWPARAREGEPRRRRRGPAAWSAWLANRCCLLHLALYAACLAVALLPTLALLGGLAGLLRSGGGGRHGPALRGAPQGRPRYHRWLEAAAAAPGGPEPAARRYRVCKTFRVAPFRQVSWLLVSLSGRPRPRPGGPRRPSGYSVDRGTEALGAVRVAYATSSL